MEGDGAARDRDRTAGRDRPAVDGDDRERVAVDVAVVGEDRDRGGTVLSDREGVGERRRRIVDRRHRDGDGGEAGAAVAVRDPVGEAVGAGEVGVRRVGEAAIREKHDRAVGRPRDEPVGEGIAVGIGVRPGAVIRSQAAGQDPVLGDHEGVVGGDRGRVDDRPVDAAARGGTGRIGGGDRHPVGRAAAGPRGAGRDRAGDRSRRGVDHEPGRQAGRRECERSAVGVAEGRARCEGDSFPVGVPERRERVGGRRVVQSVDPHGEHRRREAAGAVRDGVADARRPRRARREADEVRARIEGEAAIRPDGEGAAGRARHGGADPARGRARAHHRQDVAVDVGVAACRAQNDVAGDRRVLARRRGVVGCDGGVVDRGHRAGDEPGPRGAVLVRQRVGEGDRADDVGGRGEQKGAVRLQRDRAGTDRDALAGEDRDTVDLRHREGIAVGIGVVGEHPDRDGCVLGRDEGIGGGGRCVVHRSDRDGDRVGHGRGAVADRVGEAVGPGIVRRRGVGEGAGGIDRDRAVRRRRREGVGQGVAVEVGGSRQAIAYRRVLDRREGGVIADGRVVGARDRDGENRSRGAALAVGDRVVDARAAGDPGRQVVEIGAGREVERAVGADREQAAGRAGARGADAGTGTVDRDDAQGIAVWVAVGAGTVVGEDRACDRHALDRRDGVGLGHRGRVGDPQDDGLGRRGSGGITHRHRDGVEAAIDLRGGGIDGAGDHPGGGIDREPGREAGGGKEQGVAVDVGEEARDVEADGLAVREGPVGDRRGDRRVVDRRHGDRHRVGHGAAAVAHRVGEAVGPGEVGVRRIGEGAPGADRDGAVRCLRALGVDEGIAVGVGRTRQRPGQDPVFRGRDREVGGGRRVVGAGDRDGERRRRGGAGRIGGRVGHARRAALALLQVLEGRARIEVVGAVRPDREGAAGRARHGGPDTGRQAGDRHDREGVALGISVVGQHRGAGKDRRVLPRRRRVVGRPRRGVHRHHRDRRDGGLRDVVGRVDHVEDQGARAGRRRVAHVLVADRRH
ncbi:hypothetical protein OPKNFCMD_6830 [Methylobacterium crusticola]|uniref:Uncharacterized protein n=1 Tax=Methylobacterium crusticola TaxID=1697972 RepID=A0ABQ4RA42_9HYPH|nr:hypothetical protein OPKNFCMD_6830 [Methylobacterium crusticola]